jgi:hypothetical protein
MIRLGPTLTVFETEQPTLALDDSTPITTIKLPEATAPKQHTHASTC